MGDALASVLHSGGPAAGLEGELSLYGQFAGSWAGEVRFEDPTGGWRSASAEVHFGWVLDGRAIQDVWIAPMRGEELRGPARMYGTTLRVYDPRDGDWDITWIDPGRAQFRRMTGRRVGPEIVQESREGGTISQWTFADIGAESFRWLSRLSDDQGRTWRTTGEFRLERR